MIEPARPAADFVDAFLDGAARAIAGISRDEVWQAVDMLIAAARAGRRVYLVGNGGSAATASHMAVDLAKQATVDGHPAVRAIALTDNVPLMTAFANDEDYGEIFVRQLEVHLEPGDVVVAISTSGNSANVIRAAEHARARGARVIALTGCDGGRLRAVADCCVFVPCADVSQQEIAHLAIDHVMAMAISARLHAGAEGAVGRRVDGVGPRPAVGS